MTYSTAVKAQPFGIISSCCLSNRSMWAGRSYWQISGGGIESNETEEQCVQREMLEVCAVSP